jgi:hypothetical protein
MRESFDVDEQIVGCGRDLKERKSYRNLEEQAGYVVHDSNFVVDHPDLFLADHISGLKAGRDRSRFLLDYIDTNLLPDGKTIEDLSPAEEDILALLSGVAMPTIFDGDAVPPLACLELYICCHKANKPQLPFVSDWIQNAFVEFFDSNIRHKPKDLASLFGLKHEKRTTPFTAYEIADQHYRLAYLVHAYRIIGNLKVEDAVIKTIKLYSIDNDYLRKVYYEHKVLFSKWESDFIELGYQETDLPDLAVHIMTIFPP